MFEYVTRCLYSGKNAARLYRLLTFLLLGFFAPIGFAARPIEMKLLVIAATGSEPSLAAIRSFLDHLGTPYEIVLPGQGQPLPNLDDGTKGNYQGIILVTGNLGICDPDCHSALTPQQWAQLDAYTATYSVRTLSYYTYPEPRYGLQFRDTLLTTTQAPATVSLTPDALSVFSYLRQNRDIPVAGAFAYLADPISAAGETTTPLLRIGDATVAVIHTTSDGREYLALTIDNSPVLRHSLLLNYGLISWVTKGVFLGSRRTFLTPQVDDLFLADNLFTEIGGTCTPAKPIISPATPPAPDCPKLRIAGADLANLRTWQDAWNAQPQTNRFKVGIAYNGIGVKPDSQDDLTAEAQRSAGNFFWINHTYSHKNLDCYTVTPAGDCQPATYDQSYYEIQQNFQAGQQVGLPADPLSIITPAISGLNSSDFLFAASDLGVRYVVSDMSIADELPSAPNTGALTPLNDAVVFVPRLATNIFYNATVPGGEGADGSETDEYNYFFGPSGIVRVGGQGGAPFFTDLQTYAQVIERESDALVQLMLRYEPYPCMFHQSNLFGYDVKRSLFTDVIDRTLQKFTDISALPVLSLAQSEIGKLLEDRMGWLASGVHATLIPGESITISVDNSAKVPVTGVCAMDCGDYGGDKQSAIAIRGGESMTVSLLSR
jgi:hypothetical protein